MELVVCINRVSYLFKALLVHSMLLVGLSSGFGAGTEVIALVV